MEPDQETPGMKRSVFIFITLFLAVAAMAQQVNQEVIASAGGYNVNGDLSISWTLGETIVPTFRSQDGTLILTHGFQQKLVWTAIQENLASIVNITLFPNPAGEIVNLQFDEPVDEEINVYMLDTQGKLVKTDVIEAATVEKQVNLQDLPAGIYYFKLVKGKLSNVYKVVKL